jgi:NADPH:quinone reductase-like Zn-dependent oxidoreductase
MKTLRSHEVGGPDSLVLDDVPVPVPGPGQVLIAVKSCAINYPDALMIRDLYQFKPRRPYAPGGEVAGVIEAVGDGVTAFKPGDRVLGSCGTGGLAEQVVAETTRLYPLPDGISFEAGSALLMTYGTTIYGLKDRGNLKVGETLLILGAAGGVGISAIELGKALGARVIAAVSTEEKAAIAREAGADEVVVYGRGPFDKDQSKALADKFKAACGENGADVIYDIVGGEYAEPALRAIGWEGRYLVIGFTAGIPKIPLNLTLLKSCDIRGVFWGAFVARNPRRNDELMAELLDMLKAGKVTPRISASFPLERGGEAIALLENRQATGKVVVTP